MAQLTARAREDFESVGLSVEEVAQSIWRQPEWRGDACGCTDDRCIGHHHDEYEPCGCRDVVINEYLRGLAADSHAIDLWHRRIEADGDTAELARIDEELTTWIKTFHPIATSRTFGTLDDGREGIITTSRYNDLRHLAWAAPVAVVE